MLESISIKSVATYNDDGIHVVDLKKINFIYGANGTGKTTITKFLDNPSDTLFSDSSFVWRGGLPLKTLVYNKDFRAKNFGRGSIDGVFTLGQATKEHIESIAEMQKELDAIKENGIKKKESLAKVTETKTKLEDEFRDIAWDNVYKKYEKDFKDAFTGYMKSKDSFKSKLLVEHPDNTSMLRTYEYLKEKADTVFGEPPKEIKSITTIEFENILTIEKDAIWAKKIIGKADVAIAALIEKLNLSDWVNEGRSYVQDNNTCPFCQEKTISDSFKKQLENYFDESFVKDTSIVKKQSNEYLRLSANLINILEGIELAEKSNSSSKLDIEKFSNFLKTFSSLIATNKELLNSKIKELSRSIELVSTEQQLKDILTTLEDANTAIDAHNLIVSNFRTEKETLTKEIWRFLCNDYDVNIKVFLNKIKGSDAAIENITKEREQLLSKYNVLKNKIKDANKNVTSIQPSIDEINLILKSYGFTNFEIVPSADDKNQYQILRENGTIAESTLSEGEVTFITFLYFLQLAKGSTVQETISEERILVIDDPISSLDSSVLFVVSSLIKEFIKSIKKSEGNIKQLILLTHNVYFHKEVTFIDGRTKSNNETKFWILRKKNKITQIEPFDTKNPINSSYQLLWQELNSPNNSSISVQNTMRRIIENYFKILGKYGDDDLIGKFSTKPEQEICRSLICWINDGSHSIPDDLFVQSHDETIDKYFEVFKEIFNKMGHPEHYNMMMRTEATA